MPKVVRRPKLPKDMPAADLPTPPRVAAVNKIASREERKVRLSELLYDPAATGAEVVAASRLLEGMERTDNGSDNRGLPPPTNMPEQTARLVKILTAGGIKATLAALEIIARRVEIGRANAFNNRAAGLNPMALSDYHLYKKRILGPKYTEEDADGGERGDSLGPERRTAGAAAADDAGVRELRGAEEVAGPAAEPHELDGERDSGAGEEAR